MKLFGIGNIKSIYDFLKSKIKDYRLTLDKEPVVISSAKIAMCESVALEPTDIPAEAEGKVVYITWPLKAQTFIDMQHGDGRYPPDEYQRGIGEHDEIENINTMNTIAASQHENSVIPFNTPQLIMAPVLKPVMQDEGLVSVDILQARGISIRLAKHSVDYYGDLLEPEPKQDEDDVKTNSKKNIKHDDIDKPMHIDTIIKNNVLDNLKDISIVNLDENENLQQKIDTLFSDNLFSLSEDDSLNDGAIVNPIDSTITSPYNNLKHDKKST